MGFLIYLSLSHYFLLNTISYELVFFCNSCHSLIKDSMQKIYIAGQQKLYKQNKTLKLFFLHWDKTFTFPRWGEKTEESINPSKWGESEFINITILYLFSYLIIFGYTHKCIWLHFVNKFVFVTKTMSYCIFYYMTSPLFLVTRNDPKGCFLFSLRFS